MTQWSAYPHDENEFLYEGDELHDAWSILHLGDCEPWPDADCLGEWISRHPRAAPAGFDGDLEELAATLQQAWRCHHAGQFELAAQTADACGLLGHVAANKASGIQATYLEAEVDTQRSLFLTAVARAERAVETMPDDPNSHYFHAFNLGRYSQSISIVNALKQGIGGKTHKSLSRTLELQPDHAEAHTALGMYHAEIIDKVGKLIGGMTYGASVNEALHHFERALELTPEAPIAHIEYGNGLYLLFGDRRVDDVTDLYIKAAELAPQDAMEKLDIEAALAELE